MLQWLPNDLGGMACSAGMISSEAERNVGAWAAGPFQNHDALDFLAELSEMKGIGLRSRLASALALSPVEYLDLLEASEAIAARG